MTDVIDEARVATNPGALIESAALPESVAASKSERSLLDRLLSEQQQLSAVDEFAVWHTEASAQARHYSRLIPATAPAPGQQFAFDVDLDRCSGCKACVTACHSLNGLDETETWRDVGLLIGGTSTNPVMQHVTTACHHCLDPACMVACPVDAYEKNPITGIVKHLDDQCFGCQYCTLACPYDVPKYHAGKGIVRKCDMCSDRLAVGEAPACVQACPHEAISIRIVDTEQVVADSQADVFLPAAPEPHITYPTTTYRTKRAFPRNLLPVDYESVSPQHPHWPLILMLVLTQLSVGAFVAGQLLESILDEAWIPAWRPAHSVSALSFGLLALGASTLHLGRPRFAYRAVIGLRHSWLSREIVAFGAFAGAAVFYAAGSWFGPDVIVGSVVWQQCLGWTVGASGIVGVFCSIMIYAFTQRAFWCFSHTCVRFGLTSALLGLATIWLTMLALSVVGDATVEAIIQKRGSLICQAMIVVAVLKLGFELSLFRYLADRQNHSMRRSAVLMSGPLAGFTLARFACGVLGGLAMPALLLRSGTGTPQEPVVMMMLAGMLFMACLAGELIERYLFFAAIASPRMPGSLKSS
jgi:formate dehydrogenase iron-sulfur subunit